jgi:hypothetical protein
MISQEEHRKLFQQSIASQICEDENEFIDKNDTNKSMDNFRGDLRNLSNVMLIEDDLRTQEKA